MLTYKQLKFVCQQLLLVPTCILTNFSYQCLTICIYMDITNNSPHNSSSDLGSDLNDSSRNQDMFINRLKNRREELKLSQEELGKKIGVSTTSIQNWESGAWPKGNFAIELSNALGCSLDWLLKGEGKPPGYKVEAETALKLNDSRVEYTKKINADVLQQIIEAVEEGLVARKLVAAPDKKAEFIAWLYEYFIETGKDVNKETVEKHLRLVA